MTSALATLFEKFFGTRAVHIVADSRVFADGIHTRVFDDTRGARRVVTFSVRVEVTQLECAR